MKTSPLPWQTGNFDVASIYTTEEAGPTLVARCERRGDAALVVKALTERADLLALRDAVGLLLDPKHFRTEGDHAALVAAYEKVKP